MEYHKTITLKDGRACTLRNGTAEDGQALLNIFNVQTRNIMINMHCINIWYGAGYRELRREIDG